MMRKALSRINFTSCASSGCNRRSEDLRETPVGARLSCCRSAVSAFSPLLSGDSTVQIQIWRVAVTTSTRSYLGKKCGPPRAAFGAAPQTPPERENKRRLSFPSSDHTCIPEASTSTPPPPDPSFRTTCPPVGVDGGAPAESNAGSAELPQTVVRTWRRIERWRCETRGLLSPSSSLSQTLRLLSNKKQINQETREIRVTAVPHSSAPDAR